MVGRPVPEPKAETQAKGAVQVELTDVVAKGLDHVTSRSMAARSSGSPAFPETARASSPISSADCWRRHSGTVRLFGDDVAPLDAASCVAARRRRAFRRTATRTASSPACRRWRMSITERYRDKPFSRASLFDWPAVTRFTEKIIADYDVKCPSPQADVRTMSGGNMQKLILGRVLSSNPRFILACQPVRGLDVGADRLCACAIDRGAQSRRLDPAHLR